MPIFSYFAVVGSVLAALLFLTPGSPEKGAPVVTTSTQAGLPKPWRPEPTPSPAIASFVQPDPDPDPVAKEPAAKVEPAGHTARAEAPPKKKRVVRTQPRPEDTRQNQAWSRNSDPGPFGGGGFFGRF